VGVHLTEPQSEGVEILLERTPRRVDDRLLLGDLGAPGIHLGLRVADAEEGRGFEPAVEHARARDECDG
jgi:hypothetical protein